MAKSFIHLFFSRDKKANYVFISENGIDGLELADSLTKKGYKISWIMGGMQRWE